jgi:TetR/AcrR family transcriptional regulator, regulator of autoinduction and epiphytic fitness
VSESQIDGRTVRAQRTRAAIVDALLALLDEAELRPSVDQIAARAGVSPRSVFQHFGDRESLLRALGARQAERVKGQVRRLPSEGALEERLDAFMDQRVKVFEFIFPVRRSALLDEPFSEYVHEGLQEGRRLERAEPEYLFAAELAAVPEDEREAVRAALGAVTSWSAWQALRSHQKLDVPEAAAAMRAAVSRLLLGRSA